MASSRASPSGRVDTLTALLLAASLLGLSCGIAGVHNGWAFGSVADLRPPFPAPFRGGELRIYMGWLDGAGVVSTKQFPIEIQVGQDYAVWGGLLTAVNAVAVLVALGGGAHMVASSGVLPSKLQLAPTRIVKLAMTAAGVAVLVLSAGFYIGMAAATRQHVHDQLEKFQLQVYVWPLPSWASLGTMLAGGLLAYAGQVAPCDGDEMAAPLLGGTVVDV